MFLLNADSDDLRFPPVDLASPEGLLAIGGDLRAERLLEAYRHGIFPWYNRGQPILWWSPDPRAVLYPDRLKVSRSLRKTLRAGTFQVGVDTAFAEVIRECAAPRTEIRRRIEAARLRSAPGGRSAAEEGSAATDDRHHTWITPEMLEAYMRLHELGYAHSIEARRNGALVGGLYGVAVGGAFFGESMFSRFTDASKVALVYLAEQLRAWGFAMIDCQLPTAHLESLGAESIRRGEFLKQLERALARPTRYGPWRFDSDLAII